VSVAAHLGIRLGEYDARIRTFIPDYEEMLDVAARAVPRHARMLVDLGTGTGALAARCARVARRAHIVGIDADREILTVAARRLGRRAEFIADNFLRATIPRCDVVVAAFALHHVRTRAAKGRLYTRIRSALQPGGVLISVDCQPSAAAGLAAAQRSQWLAHLERSYSRKEAKGYLRAWAHEDTYVPLDAEMRSMNRAGLAPEVIWRKGAFAVLVAEV